MARWADHVSNHAVTMLCVGDSGAGKTHASVQLANAGYKTFVFDFDNGLAAAGAHLDEVGQENFFFQTFKDGIEGKPQAWVKFREALKKPWMEGEENLGTPSDWDEDCVLVIDTATGVFDAVKNYILNLSNQPVTAQMSQPQWGLLNTEINNLILKLTSGSLKCNVIVNTHWQLVDNDEGSSRFYPRIGSKPNSVHNGGRHFDNVVEFGAKKDRFIYRTGGRNDRDLKVARPMDREMPADMPALFQLLKG